MKELVTYAAQAGVLTACSWLVYKAVFARDTLHRVRRFVLLGLLAASFALPVCRITIDYELQIAHHEQSEVFSDGGNYEPDYRRESLSAENSEHAGKQFWPTATNVLGIIYLAGVCMVLAYRLAGVARVRRIMRRAGGRFATDDGIVILLVAGDVPPFSFSGRIVMSEEDSLGDGAEMILRHETVHLRERHGWDLAAANLAAALLWFDPFVWLVRRDLVIVHEIAADSGVLNSGFEAKKYQYLLISKIARTEGLLPMANHFRTSDLRKRIIIMRKKTSRAAAFKTLLLLPLAAIALAVFAETRYVVSEPADKPETKTVTTANPEKETFHMPFDVKTRIAKRDDGSKAYLVTFNTSGPYGKRTHPITGKENLHNGIDIIPTNDTIRASYSGIVKSAAFEEGIGNKLVIEHSGGLETVYGHLASFLVAEGTAVKGGQPIAIVGNTGLSAGKHLHLEAWVNGESRDPLLTLFAVKGATCGYTEKGEFSFALPESAITEGLVRDVK